MAIQTQRASPARQKNYATIAPQLSEDFSDEYDEEAFVYGWRYVSRKRNGDVVLVRVPLTLEDVLHPKLEDFVVQVHEHIQICVYLYTVLCWQMRHDPTAFVAYDMLVNWGKRGIRGHAPDIAVFVGMHTKPRRKSLNLKKSGGRPVLVMEVTSSSTRSLDVESEDPQKPTKFAHYAKIGIPFYVIIDEANRKDGQSPPLYGYVLTTGHGYKPLKPDVHGRLWIEPVDLWLGTEGEDVVWFDSEGQAIAGYDGAQARAEEAQARAEEAQARAEKAQARAEKAQARAEKAQARAEEAQARAEEAQARAEEAESSMEIEKARAEEAEARAKEAEARAEEAEARAEEAEARAEVERARVKEAEARAKVERARVKEAEARAEVERARAEKAEALVDEAQNHILQLEKELRRLQGLE